jgi:hypothetical protein
MLVFFMTVLSILQLNGCRKYRLGLAYWKSLLFPHSFLTIFKLHHILIVKIPPHFFPKHTSMPSLLLTVYINCLNHFKYFHFWTDSRSDYSNSNPASLTNTVYFSAIWYALCSVGIFFPRFGMLYREKSGNPVSKSFRKSIFRKRACVCVCAMVS